MGRETEFKIPCKDGKRLESRGGMFQLLLKIKSRTEACNEPLTWSGIASLLVIEEPLQLSCQKLIEDPSPMIQTEFDLILLYSVLTPAHNEEKI
jgi:hypothetical protein